MSKSFSEWRSLRDNIECFSRGRSNAIITCYHSSYKNDILAVPFLCEENTFIHIIFFTTFYKIRILVRTINSFTYLFIYLFIYLFVCLFIYLFI